MQSLSLHLLCFVQVVKLCCKDCTVVRLRALQAYCKLQQQGLPGLEQSMDAQAAQEPLGFAQHVVAKVSAPVFGARNVVATASHTLPVSSESMSLQVRFTAPVTPKLHVQFVHSCRTLFHSTPSFFRC